MDGKCLVSYIVSCRFGISGLKGTLNKLAKQTLENIEAYVVVDNMDSVQGLLSDFAHDERIRFIENPKGEVAGLNGVLARCSGDVIVVCFAGDKPVLRSAEILYSRIKLKKLDVVVARYVSGFDKRRYSPDSTQSKILDLGRNNEKSVAVFYADYAGTPVMGPDRFTCLEDFRFGLLGRIGISNDFIKTSGVVFRDFSIATEWHFVMACFALADSAERFGANLLASRLGTVDQYEFIGEEQLSFVDRACQSLSELSLEKVKGLCFSRKGDELRAAEVSAWIPRMFSLIEISFLNEFVISRAWASASGSFEAASRLINECVVFLSSGDLQLVEKALWPAVEAVQSVSKELLSNRPLLTVALPYNASPSTCRNILNSLKIQAMPSYEIVVSTRVFSVLGEEENVRCVGDASSNAEFLNLALSSANSELFLAASEKMTWTDANLRTAVQQLKNQSGDCAFLSACPVDAKLKMPKGVDFAFGEVFASFAGDYWVNQFDSLLGNKIFVIPALKKAGFLFSSHPVLDVRRLYAGEAYLKAPHCFVRSREKKGKFFDRASKVARARYCLRKLPESIESYCGGGLLRRLRKRRLTKQVLFVTKRENDFLPPNLKAVYEALPSSTRKKVIAKRSPHSAALKEEITKELECSQVIVTDDYVTELLKADVDERQSVMQLWHAAGAFKRFGLDCFGMDRATEKKINAKFTDVIVSSEGVKDIYARAFGVNDQVVKSLGTPRTDALLSQKERELSRESFFSDFPSLKGKKIIAYLPTFRQVGSAVVRWDPEIDWESLQQYLESSDTYFLVKRHPLDKSVIGLGVSSRIIQADCCRVNDLISVSDLVVTDYSSVIFDALLLDKPILFYAPDFDIYERDFYLNFPEDLPGKITYSFAGFLESLEKGDWGDCSIEAKRLEIKNRYLGACDGHSAHRVADYIMEKLR